MIRESEILNILLKNEVNNLYSSVRSIGFCEKCILTDYEKLAQNGIPYINDFELCKFNNATQEETKEIKANLQAILDINDLHYIDDNFNNCNLPIIEVW